MIGFEGLREQTAAVESMLTQHALTPTVNGGNRRFVHPLRCDIQTPGTTCPLLDLERFAQLCDQGVRGFNFVPKKTRCFSKTCTNAIAQFFGRGIGEGDDQYLWR